MKNNFDYAKKKKKKSSFIFRHGEWECFILLVPLIPIVAFIEKLQERYYNSLSWSEEKATKVLNKILPKILDYDDESKEYSYCMDWNNWITVNHAPVYLRKWTQKFIIPLQDFLWDNYENPYYNKATENDGYERWVIFIEKT